MMSEQTADNNKSNGKSIVGLGTNSKDNQAIYDEWAANYEKGVREWGYQLPEQAASLLFRHAAPAANDATMTIKKKIAILDAGAGDGLTGVALRNVGFSHDKADITGSDISPGMLKKAEERKCYNRTCIVDLNQPLSNNQQSLFAFNSFDIVHCIGTLTYVDPSAGTLSEFIRLVKSGGWICYSNRTDKLDAWAPVEEALADQWTLVEKLGPVPYLPQNPEYADKVKSASVGAFKERPMVRLSALDVA